MKNRIIGPSVAVCLLVLAVSASQAQQELTYRELPNLHKVSDQLYRGAQPSEAGLKKLSELGIKTIINLRGSDDRARLEEKETKSEGLRYFNIAMPGLSAPSDEQVAQVMAIINNPDNQPVFIHCKRGSDRTGTIVAVYRISHDGWTADRAIAEARSRGMSWAEFGMRSYISNYYGRQTKAKATETATSR